MSVLIIIEHDVASMGVRKEQVNSKAIRTVGGKEKRYHEYGQKECNRNVKILKQWQPQRKGER